MMSVTVGGGPGMLVMGVTQSHTVTHMAHYTMLPPTPGVTTLGNIKERI